MPISRDHWFELFGGIFGLAIAFAGVALGLITLGPVGKAALVVSVPAGVFLGWLLTKVLIMLQRIFSEIE